MHVNYANLKKIWILQILHLWNNNFICILKLKKVDFLIMKKAQISDIY